MSLISTHWRLDASAFADEIDFPHIRSIAPVFYRFGSTVVAVDSDYDRVLRALDELYAECMVPESAPEPRVHCIVRTLDNPRRVFVRFVAPTLPDPVNVALSLLENHHPSYVASDSRVPGRRTVHEAATPEYPLLSVTGGDVLMDPDREPPEFLLNYIVATAMILQRDLMFVHAASIAIGGAGVLITGATRAGKTTLSLTLAARGHAFLGDDVACLQPATARILPFRRSASIRPWLGRSAFDEHLDAHAYDSEPLPDGQRRRWVRVAGIFPGATSRPVELRAAFFLRGFREQAAVEPFRPSLSDIETLKLLSYEHTVSASWGYTPGQRMMKFLTIRDLLSKRPCYLLDVGSPGATADLIERTLEQQWD